MNKTRSELREKCMVILYQWDLLKDNNVDELIDNNLDMENDFVKDIVYGVVTHKNDIDAKANELMTDWTIDRIEKTGASILRIG